MAWTNQSRKVVRLTESGMKVAGEHALAGAGGPFHAALKQSGVLVVLGVEPSDRGARRAVELSSP
jgi:hypothetical protein